jgi:hypothetical protein
MPQLGQRKASASTGDYLLGNMDFPIQNCIRDRIPEVPNMMGAIVK